MCCWTILACTSVGDNKIRTMACGRSFQEPRIERERTVTNILSKKKYWSIVGCDMQCSITFVGILIVLIYWTAELQSTFIQIQAREQKLIEQSLVFVSCCGCTQTVLLFFFQFCNNTWTSDNPYFLELAFDSEQLNLYILEMRFLRSSLCCHELESWLGRRNTSKRWCDCSSLSS